MGFAQSTHQSQPIQDATHGKATDCPWVSDATAAETLSASPPLHKRATARLRTAYLVVAADSAILHQHWVPLRGRLHVVQRDTQRVLHPSINHRSLLLGERHITWIFADELPTLEIPAKARRAEDFTQATFILLFPSVGRTEGLENRSQAADLQHTDTACLRLPRAFLSPASQPTHPGTARSSPVARATRPCSRPALQCSRAPCCHGPSQRPLPFPQHLLPCTAVVPAVVGAAVSHSVPLAINFLVAGQGSVFGPCKHVPSLTDWQKASLSTSGLDITAGATR